MGRPRNFCPEIALGRALDVFWRKGFEGASLTDLTKAMGINRPSLYAAFGNKEELFRKALDRYEATCMAFAAEALAAPAAREVIERLLRGYADMLTAKDHPPGALETNGALACSNAAEPVRLALAERRRADERALCRRLARARDEGDLPASCEPAALACFVMALAHGMAVKASSGTSRAELHAAIDVALGALGMAPAPAPASRTAEPGPPPRL